MAFVVSEGALAATDRPASAAPYALALPNGSAEEYSEIWRTQAQVRTVISFLARNIAQLTVHHYERVSDTDRRRLADSPLAQLLGRPNPFRTRYATFDTLVNDLGIYDAAYWAKVKPTPDAPVGALLRLNPRHMKPNGDNPFMADSYTLAGSKGKVTIPRDRLVVFHGYNPDDQRSGCSSIEALRRILLEEWRASEYREQLWRNGARLGGYIQRPLDAPGWSDKARSRFRKEWQDQYSGDGPNAGGTPILDDGMTWHTAGVTPEQAEYVSARKLTREEVAAAFHIPPPMVGILDHATFSNIKEQHKHLYMDTLGPWLVSITEELELQLLPEFPNTAGTYLEYNLRAKLEGSFEEEAAQLSQAVGGPWMTRNEARARRNLPQVEGGDELITPLSVTTGGGDAAPTDVDGDDEAAPKRRKRRVVRFKARAAQEQVDWAKGLLERFFERQGKAVQSALGAAVEESKAARRAGRNVKAPQLDEVFDAERWDAELASDLYGVNVAAAKTSARATVDALGMDPEDYDEDETVPWLTANAERSAGAINGATQRALVAALGADDPAGLVLEVFAGYVAVRAGNLARSHLTQIAGFATTEVGRQSGRKATKTWLVTSGNPRPSHAAMDGETVALDEPFSNGAQWPGDSSLDEDERAGCTCDIDIEFAD